MKLREKIGAGLAVTGLCGVLIGAPLAANYAEKANKLVKQDAPTTKDYAIIQREKIDGYNGNANNWGIVSFASIVAIYAGMMLQGAKGGMDVVGH